MKQLLSLLVILAISSSVFADGLLMPNDENYPADFLRHRATIIDIEIEELYAMTVVYQEFVNDWHETTDAVWSFPLPYDARSIKLLYTRHDTIFQAILIESSQSTNPGTGEGGVAALVNDYIGVNGLRLQLRGIEPGDIQKVELSYVSLVDYFQGECHYKYPLETMDFTNYPVEHLELSVRVESDRDISDFSMPSHPNFDLITDDVSQIEIEMLESMAFLGRNLEFTYNLSDNGFGRNFYSSLNDEVAGHFAFFLTPPNLASLSETLNRKVVFLLSTSSTMLGFKLEASIAAMKLGLDELGETDFFNIIHYDYWASNWRSALVPASEANIASAKSYLDGLTASGGSNLQTGLEEAIEQFDDSDYHNAILAFTDGRAPLDPVGLATSNTHNIAIFPIAIGEDVSHARLDMTARMNLGFVTYLDEESDLVEDIHRVFQIVNRPLFNNVTVDFNKDDVHDIFPETYPSTYAGSYSLYSGRYDVSGSTSMDIWGDGIAGQQQYGFPLDFRNDTTEWDLSAYLWAKQAIDNLEQGIEVLGETPARKDSLIALSLRYQMRCRYTAYFADYEFENPTIVDDTHPVLPNSTLVKAYPNPFNPVTTFQIQIGEGESSTPLVLNIYDIRGRLIYSIDLSGLAPGTHQISWFARGINGSQLASGVYFAVLESGNFQGKPLKVLLLR
ncbi:MAG: VWA domain-containing protein [Candidatus Marinimicrobia bacterium]|nr:VWA domain-containing protein [Candidatus Neomarinimicrobiota bacterium]